MNPLHTKLRPNYSSPDKEEEEKIGLNKTTGRHLLFSDIKVEERKGEESKVKDSQGKKGEKND